RGAAQRHHDRRWGVRHLPGHHARRRAACRHDLFHPEQPHRDSHRAEGQLSAGGRRCGRPAMKTFSTAAACLTLLTGLAVAQAQQWPMELPPRPLAPHAVTFPPYEVRKMDNGLTVVLVSQNEQPSVSVRMIVRAGAAQDPRDKLGLAMLSATLLDQGAGGRSAEQLADAIDFIGGVLSTGAGTDLSFVNTIVLKDDYDTGLALMADVVRRPTFLQAEIDRQKQQAL